MKVLMINHFPLTGSGSGTYTRNIAVHLVKKGHEACIVFPENTTRFSEIPKVSAYPVYFTHEEEIEGALPFNFPCFTTHPRSTTTFYDLSDTQLEMYLAAFESVIKTAAAELKPDIIHGQHIWLLSRLAKNTGVPYVLTAHGTDLMGYQKDPRFRQYADEAAAGAKKVITISNDNDVLVRKLFPDAAEKTVFMRNGYDPEVFYPCDVTKAEALAPFGFEPPEHLVFFAGKLTYFKGVDVLINAARLYEDNQKIMTIIAGEGELAEQLKKQAADLKLKNLKFLNFLDVVQLRSLYCAADVSVMPSRREPFGLVAIEALACGSPVIATNQGGLPDIINDKVGALVDVDDAAGLADAIMNELFRSDRPERGQYAAKYAFENYAQDSLMEQLIEIYK